MSRGEYTNKLAWLWDNKYERTKLEYLSFVEYVSNVKEAVQF